MTATQPNQLHLEVAAERGALFSCPTCGKLCKAHDFAEFTWRHLNFFQHHCYVTAKVPRIDCPEDGVLRITVPWAREGSRFTLLFEQAALMLVRETLGGGLVEADRLEPGEVEAVHRLGDVVLDDAPQALIGVTPIQAARWRITHFLRHASQVLGDDPILVPVRKEGAGLLRKSP